ncbi:MAG: DNA-binding response regulator [Chloroflexi bacterium]|nr:MAG: DNA-binding response regulator [Chloroflexota bacterium]
MSKVIIKVMIVDDHPMVRKGLAMFIDGSPNLELAGEANDSESALVLYKSAKPDVVLMDMVLNNASGIDVIKELRNENAEVAIIALTSFYDESLVKGALKAGARGFLYKNISIEELADAIRQVYLGRMILDPRASTLMLNLVNETNAVQQNPDKLALSQRENDVLHFLVQGLTNKQIASQLKLQPSTIKQYISNILSKLGVQSRTEAATVAIKLGLVE